MKRYYSHYTFIYPDTYLKNSIVEMDETNNIVNVFPYEKELESTTFHPGVLFFIPNSFRINSYLITYTKNKIADMYSHNPEQNLEVKAVICNLYD